MMRSTYLKRDIYTNEFTDELDEEYAKRCYELNMRPPYDNHSKPRDPNHSIVHWAVQFADSRAAQLIIAKNPQFVTVADAIGMTPLHYLIQSSFAGDGYFASEYNINAEKAIMSALKDAGADFNVNN